MQESGFTREEAITTLMRIPHGDLENYNSFGRKAATTDPEFYAHFIAWNGTNGTILDSQIALPVLATSALPDAELDSNARALLAKLDPKSLVRAWHYRQATGARSRAGMKLLVHKYLRVREAKQNWWDKAVIAHKKSMRALYAMSQTKPSDRAQKVLFKNSPVGIHRAVRDLRTVSPLEAAGIIQSRRLPFLIAKDAVGRKGWEDPRVMVALIGQMSPTEVDTNLAWIERNGGTTVPEIRAALDVALERGTTSKKSALKSTRATAHIKDDKLRAKVEGTQTRRMQRALGVEGNWLIIGDRSDSMHHAIPLVRMIASTLAACVKEKVSIVWVNDAPMYYDATGKEYAQIELDTRRITANSTTGLGCGLEYAERHGLPVDGIVIATDGQENRHPAFADAYASLCKSLCKEVPVYVFYINGRFGTSTNFVRTIPATIFDLRTGTIDDYSVPNMVMTMRSNRYSLVDEIMQTPLLDLKQVLAA